MPAVSSAKFKKLTGQAFGCGCLSLLLCVFGGFLLITRMFREDSAKLPSDLDLARSMELPLEVGDLHQGMSATSENAAPVYLEAIKEFHKLPEDESRHLWLPRNPTARDRAVRNKAIKSFAPVLRLIEQASRLPRCDFGELQIASASMRFVNRPMLQHEREFSQISNYVIADARIKISQLDFDGAVQDLLTLKRMANHCPEFSVTTGVAWPFYADMSMMSGLWRVTLRYPKDPVMLGQISQLVNDIKIPNLYKSIQARFVLGRTTIQQMKSLQEVGLDQTTPEAFTKAVDALFQSPGVRQAFDERFVRTYIRTFKALPQDHEDWMRIHTVLKRLNKEVADDQSIDNVINRALGIASANAPLMHGWLQTQQRILAQAISVLRQRSTTGHYPPNLPLTGELSIDPFSQKPLRYAPTLYGFEISNTVMDFGKQCPYYMKRPIVFKYDERREPPINRTAY